MKKFLKSLVLFAAAAMALTSCENEAMNEGIATNDAVTYTFVTGAPESRTSVSIDGENATFWWDDAESFTVLTDNATDNGAYRTTNVGFSKDGDKAVITATFDQAPASNSKFAVIYPKDAWVSSSNTKFAATKVVLPTEQKLYDGKYDPNADLLISNTVNAQPNGTSELRFTRLASIAKMNVKGVSNGEIIKSVRFAIGNATENANDEEMTKFTGRYKVNFTNEEAVVEEKPYYGYNYVNLTNGSIVADVEGTDIWFTCLPGNYTGSYSIEIVTNLATYTKTNNNFTGTLAFTVGDVLGFTINVTGCREEIAETFPYEESFKTSLGLFNVEQVSGSAAWYWTNSYAVANGYNKGASETWLISPSIDLSSAVKPALMFEHATNYFTSNSIAMADVLGVYVRTKDSEWAKLNITEWSTGNSWTFNNSGDIDLSAYKGQKVQIGFQYTCGTKAGAWEIKNFKVCEAPFSMSVANTNIELENTASEGTIEVTAKNTEGYTFSAAKSESAEWLTISMTGNTISYSATANTGNARNATITVTATGATTETLNILVSQAAGAGATQQEVTTATITFDDKSKRTEFSTTKQVWVENGITVTNDKYNSTNAVADYANPARFYKNSKLTIATPGNITKIVFKTNGSSYTTNLQGAIDNETVSSNEVTLVLDGTASTFSFSLTGGQVQMKSITVTYVTEGEGGGTTPTTPVDQTVTFTAKPTEVTVGETVTVTATANTTVTYTSSNTSIATVDANTGVVTGVAVGSVTITATAAATAEYNSATATHTITVKAAEQGGGDDDTTTGTVVLSEEFDNTVTAIDNNTAIGTTTFANFSGATEKAYKGVGGIKFGTSSLVGYITSKALDLSSPFTVKLDAGRYKEKTSEISVTVGAQTKTITNDQLKNCSSTSDALTTFTLEFDAATNNSTIKISTTNIGKRAVIDNVIVTVYK